MKKAKAKKQAKRLNWKVLGISASSLVLLTIIAAQFGFNVFLFNRVSKLEDASIKTLIQSAIENLNKPAIVEPKTGAVYLPEPKLVLPPYPEELFNGISYRYSPPGSDGQDEELQIASGQAMSNAIAVLNNYQSDGRVFEAVPIAQACARQIIIKFKAADDPGFDNYTKVGTRQLADGRTLSLFSANNCTVSPEMTVNYLQQIQSYN